MSDDRTLLEWAARAAGVELEGVRPDGRGVRINGTYWAPLHDDGDALRLAVKLGIDVSPAAPYVGSSAEAMISPLPHIKERVGEDSDPYAATRRAIVRAAAEIGRASAKDTP